MSVVPFSPQPPSRQSLVSSMDDVFSLAETIANTDFVPRGLRGNQPAIIAAILYGREVGLEPMTSLQTIAVIDGRPTMAAEAQRALILAAGHELTLEESTNTRATWAGRRANDRTTTRATWTLDDAKRARLAGRPAWQAYPADMLVARASARLARAIFPDVIRGMAATEELELVDEGATAVVDAGLAAPAERPSPATRRRRRVGTTAGSSPTPAGPSSSASATGAGSTTADAEPEPIAATAAAEDSAPAGEQTAPEPAPAPGPDQPDAPAPPDLPSKAQMGLMFALYTQKGIDDRADKLAFAEEVLGRTVETSKALSALDVSRIIDALNALPDRPDEPEGGAPAPTGPEPDPPPPAAEGELPADEQAVLDALADELDATPVPYNEFPEGY